MAPDASAPGAPAPLPERLPLAPGPLRGTVAAISAKSFAHRALLAAALSEEPCEVLLNLRAAGLDVTARALPALGVAAADVPGGIRVTPQALDGAEGGAPTEIDCGESGSTLRFLLPVLAARGRATRLTGRGRLPERPLSPLRELLTAHGAAFSAPALPFVLSGRLTPGEFALPGDVSSQYLTGLLLALPILTGDSALRLTSPLQSAGYVAVTLAVLRDFGIRVEESEGAWRVPGGQRYHSPGRYQVEGDWSNAAFWLTANALPASGASNDEPGAKNAVTVTGLNPASTQPDRAIEKVLAAFARPGALDLDVSQFPDLVPVLAVAAALRPGETRFVNGARLRLKESDRIAATARMVNALGGRAAETPDGLAFAGVARLSGGTVESANDHRLAMAAAVAATVCAGPVTIVGPAAVNKSYPGFFMDFARLRG